MCEIYASLVDNESREKSLEIPNLFIIGAIASLLAKQGRLQAKIKFYCVLPDVSNVFMHVSQQYHLFMLPAARWEKDSTNSTNLNSYPNLSPHNLQLFSCIISQRCGHIKCMQIEYVRSELYNLSIYWINAYFIKKVFQ